MSEKRQRAIAKRLKRKPARDAHKAKQRRELNAIIRADRRKIGIVPILCDAPVPIWPMSRWRTP